MVVKVAESVVGGCAGPNDPEGMKTILFMVFGTRDLKCWVLGPYQMRVVGAPSGYSGSSDTMQPMAFITGSTVYLFIYIYIYLFVCLSI